MRSVVNYNMLLTFRMIMPFFPFFFIFFLQNLLSVEPASWNSL